MLDLDVACIGIIGSFLLCPELLSVSLVSHHWRDSLRSSLNELCLRRPSPDGDLLQKCFSCFPKVGVIRVWQCEAVNRLLDGLSRLQTLSHIGLHYCCIPQEQANDPTQIALLPSSVTSISITISSSTYSVDALNCLHLIPPRPEVSGLTALELQQFYDLTDTHVAQLLSCCPHLTSLYISKSFKLVQPPILCSRNKIQSLRVVKCPNLIGLGDISQPFSPALQELDALDVSFTAITAAGLSSFLPLLPSLTKLTLHQCTQIFGAFTFRSSFALSQSIGSTLRILSLKNCTNLNSLTIEGCRRLKSLDLSLCTQLFVLKLSSARSLEVLNLCMLVTLKEVELVDCSGLKDLDLSGCRALGTASVGGGTRKVSFESTAAHRLNALLSEEAALTESVKALLIGLFEGCPRLNWASLLDKGVGGTQLFDVRALVKSAIISSITLSDEIRSLRGTDETSAGFSRLRLDS